MAIWYYRLTSLWLTWVSLSAKDRIRWGSIFPTSRNVRDNKISRSWAAVLFEHWAKSKRNKYIRTRRKIANDWSCSEIKRWCMYCLYRYSFGKLRFALLEFSIRAPKEYAGALFLVKSWAGYPVVDGNPYLPGPGPLKKKLVSNINTEGLIQNSLQNSLL